MKQPKPIYSYLSAAALALVTVFTFYVFQDFGPQSVVRRFHLDAVRGDWKDLNLVSTEGIDSLPTKAMVNQLRSLVRDNASFEIVDLKRQHREVLAVVQYRLPDGRKPVVVWHVVQTPVDWRVDCRATLGGILRQAGEAP